MHSNSAKDSNPEDEEVPIACNALEVRRLLQRCGTCGRNRSPHHFKSESSMHPVYRILDPSGISYQGKDLRVVHGRIYVRLLGILYNMWLDAKAQRSKVFDTAIEVVA